MTRIEFHGGVFDDRTDFGAYLRAVARSPSRAYCPPDALSMNECIGRLSEALEGTPLRDRLRGAALEIIETGSPEEVEIANYISYEQAPGAFSRIVHLLVHNRERTEGLGLTESMLRGLLVLHPKEEILHAILIREYEHHYDGGEYAELAAWIIPEWFAEHLPPFRPAHEVLHWIAFCGPEARPKLVNALAGAGSAYVEHTVALLRARRFPTDSEQNLRTALESNPVFADALARHPNG